MRELNRAERLAHTMRQKEIIPDELLSKPVTIIGVGAIGSFTALSLAKMGIKGLNPKETVVINVSGKDLPFRGWKKLYTGKVSEGGNYLDDVDGQLRGASWDIGFDQYVSSGPEPEGKMQKWYYHTQTMRG